MAVELNHTIIPARDPVASARFLADILGLSVGPPVARFTPVTLANGVTLDYLARDAVDTHHYAFTASEEEFGSAFGRIRAAGIPYYADPGCQLAGQTYSRDHGGRGVYFRDPDNHLMEMFTIGPGARA
jgi:catechol 2,3-dioxygenase-like lactoylglutathione lyase family enzyme